MEPTLPSWVDQVGPIISLIQVFNTRGAFQLELDDVKKGMKDWLSTVFPEFIEKIEGKRQNFSDPKAFPKYKDFKESLLKNPGIAQFNWKLERIKDFLGSPS